MEDLHKSNKISVFFSDKTIIKHICLALISLPILFFLYLKFLSIYTLHDKFITVPNFSDYHISTLDSISDANNIRYVIIDSVSSLHTVLADTLYFSLLTFPTTTNWLA